MTMAATAPGRKWDPDPTHYSLSITSEAAGDFLQSFIHDQLHDRTNIVQWESFHD
jgi:hypothetical protein